MKKIYILLLAVSITIFSSCSGDFLETQPSGYLTTDQLAEIAKTNPAAVLAPLTLGLHDITAAMATGGTEDHSDFGQKSIDISLDLMSGDMALTGATYGWFSAVYNYTGQIRTSTDAYKPWRYYYRVIKNANEILDLIGSDEEIPENEDSKLYFGQAKIFRAYCYFYLVNLYQHRFQEKADSPGVPVYRSQLTPEYHTQSTVREVYSLIVEDLTDAAAALKDYDRGSNKTLVDKNVAYSYLAYAYLQMGEYQSAADAADSVIDSNLFRLMSATEIINSGFRSMSIPSWIWGYDLTVANTGGLGTFWGHVDWFTYSYASAGDSKVIDADLYASIPATDARKAQFNNNTGGSLPWLIPYYKFWDAGRVIQGDMQWTNDEVYLRIEEMYLIKAEALARLNQDVPAKAALKEVLDLRDVTAAAALASASHEQLLDAIYFNWRVEMWGEGKSLFALKRFGKTSTRSSAVDNHLYKVGESFPYNYQYMIFEIPEREILTNTLLVPQQ